MDDETGMGESTEQRMEHRYTLALGVEVHFREQYIEGMFRCQTSNIGLHGAFLPSQGIPINDKTDVELVLLPMTSPDNSTLKRLRLKAQVVRASDDGAALFFSDLDDQQVRDFRHFLLKAKIAARQFSV